MMTRTGGSSGGSGGRHEGYARRGHRALLLRAATGAAAAAFALAPAAQAWVLPPAAPQRASSAPGAAPAAALRQPSSWLLDPIRCHGSRVTGWSRVVGSKGSSKLWAVDVDTETKEGTSSGGQGANGGGAGPVATTTTPATTTPTRPLTEADRLQLQAQMLRLQAEKLRLEAEREQIQMEREALLKKQKKQQEMDRLIEKLRATKGEAAVLKQVVQSYLRSVDADVLMRLRELSAEAEAPEQALAYKQLGDGVLAAVTELDGKQAKEIREEIAFRLKDTVKLDVGNQEAAAGWGDVEELMRSQSLNRTSSIDQLTQEMMRNNSRGFSTIYAINLPQWLPREFMRTLESFEPLQDEDVRALRTEVFKMDTFFVTDVDKTPLAVAYMGTLRKSSEEVFKDVEKRLQASEGLKDRVQLFLFENPRPQMQEMGNGGMMLGDEENPEVMFMAVSTKVRPLPVGGGQVTLSLLSFGATAFNCLVYALLTFYSPQDILTKLADDPLARLADAWPIALGVVAIQLAHDAAHFAAAQAKGVKLGVPVYIPSLQVGSFGSVLRFASFPKSRKDMFDVATAGPALGWALSLAAFAIGMGMTQGAAPEVSAQWPMLPVGLFRSSLLLWQIGQALYSPDVVNLPLLNSIHVHPLAVIGALGCLTQALQSMPIGRLDGGRATTAVFGRKAATFLSASLVLYQVVSGVLLGNTLQLFWGTVVIIFQNAQEMYARDEISPVDGNRRNVLLLLWLLAALTLLPGVPWKDLGAFDDINSFLT